MTLEEHKKAIQLAIAAAELDGFDVFVDSQCCGCSQINLVITPVDEPDTDKFVYVI